MLKHIAKYLLRPKYRSFVKENIELKRIKSLPRYKQAKTNILGKELSFIDSASFYFMYDEIFRKEIYKFKSEEKNPLIIDAGSNIGLGIVYFKQLFPEAKVIAFEADKKIFKVLKKNITMFHLENIELINKALWKEETNIKFYVEGADAGRIAYSFEEENITEIETTILSQYLDNKVALLKMDIEGAELEVLQECQEQLKNVQNIFVEYHSFLKREQKLSEILNILKKAGFRFHINNTAFTSEQALFERREDFDMDMQLNIFGFRN